MVNGIVYLGDIFSADVAIWPMWSMWSMWYFVDHIDSADVADVVDVVFRRMPRIYIDRMFTRYASMRI